MKVCIQIYRVLLNVVRVGGVVAWAVRFVLTLGLGLMTAEGAPWFSARPSVQEIGRARVFEEPLAPIGGEPTERENADLAAALVAYGKRSGPDDFGSLTHFLEKHPQSPWRAALLTGMGLEYYNTAHYSLALKAWSEAWDAAKAAKDLKGRAIADRAAGELAYMYARLGRMTELEALLKSVEGREWMGSATERITGAREGLWNMQHRPEVSFKCGPYALHRILVWQRGGGTPGSPGALEEIVRYPSSQKGCSLRQVRELSEKVGLNYRMAHRERGAEWVVPSVVHWKAGHYAAMVKREGDRFQLEDPTFGNTVWATRQALEEETSGYFLIASGELPQGWRGVEVEEGDNVWGKGQTGGNDPKPNGPSDPKKPDPCPGDKGMAVANAHLMLVSLNIVDTPVGYKPPVGPRIHFTVTYNQRDAFQPANFTYSNFGPKWTCDWISYITDNPQSVSGNVNQYLQGGGTREFTGFTNATQSFGPQQYDQTLLRRTGPDEYEMLSRDGGRMVYGRPDGSSGSSRKVFLSRIVDAHGNTVTLGYDENLRIVSLTDALGQVTRLSYGNTNDLYKITRVTDPFGRFAEFAYDSLGRLTNITDVIGLNSAFVYEGGGDFIKQLVTPYGTTTFTQGPATGNTRFLETLHPDGSRDRVEYNQFVSGTSNTVSEVSIPAGMSVTRDFQNFRNTFYWSRTASASSYGDYGQAKVYHWLHSEDPTKTSGILESVKEPLEGRVWYDYAGQENATTVGASNRPLHVGRVLDDGTTQLYTYAYNALGNVTRVVDPVGRTLTYVYASNGVDVVEVMQTRGSSRDVLARYVYNAQHLPIFAVGADGQTNNFTYNARGQLVTTTNPKGETTRYEYDSRGYAILVDGPLPGTNDVLRLSYDAVGRIRTKTDDSGYTLTLEHDDLDRLTRIIHPDGSSEALTYERLDVVSVRDRAGRLTLFEFDSQRQMRSKTDEMGRTTLFEWCRCGAIKSMTDAMGRTTTWATDVQSRITAKQFADGSLIQYFYEKKGGRLQQVVDEKGQITQYTYNPDNTIQSVAYPNAETPTPGVSYRYDSRYQRLISMTDGSGTTTYTYHPVTVPATLGAHQVAEVDGPLADDTLVYKYDELGRRVSTSVGGVVSGLVVDPLNRVLSETNALGAFSMAYEGVSRRVLTQVFPNGLKTERSFGGAEEDHEVQRIRHTLGNATLSEFVYERDIRAGRITSWSQQSGVEPASVQRFGYDDANQLLSVAVTRSGSPISTLAYGYDPLGNRLIEANADATNTATYNALNQIDTKTSPVATRQLEWDARNRLVAVITGDRRTEFSYDGLDRVVTLRQRDNGVQVSLRRFVWNDDKMVEERDELGNVVKRFFSQGMRVESGSFKGDYFYTRDHLGSVRELVDDNGVVRARYDYDPYGRANRISGDVESDIGFTGLYFAREVGLNIARFRVYDPELGRWLSRDPLRNAEMKEGPNLYAYVKNNPINMMDPLGLCCESEKEVLDDLIGIRNGFDALFIKEMGRCAARVEEGQSEQSECQVLSFTIKAAYTEVMRQLNEAALNYVKCLAQGCEKKPCSKPDATPASPAPPPSPLIPPDTCARDWVTGITYCRLIAK